MANGDNYGQATIRVDGQNILATPRKDPYTDTQVADTTGAHPAQLDFFRDTATFTETTSALATSKVQGRDTNVLSRLGTATKGEKFWIYGANLLVDSPGLTLNGATGLTFPDEVGHLLGVGWFEWSFAAGGQIFMRRPLRDLPVRCVRRPVAFSLAAAATNVLYDLNGQGMYDLRVNNRPYAISQQEEMVISFRWQSGNALPTPTQMIAYMLELQGIRVFGQKD